MMGDDTSNKRKSKWATSYSKMTIEKAEMILRIEIDEIRAVPADTVIADSKPILEGSIPRRPVRPSFS